MNKHHLTASLLDEIEAELKFCGLWQTTPMSSDALASTTPFCIDTMSFPQWLQFVFVVKMRMLVTMNAPLPSNMAITPMAEESFAPLTVDTKTLLNLLQSCDDLLGENK